MESPFRKHTAVAAIRLALGAVFFISGGFKVGHTFEFIQTLAGYQMLPPGWEYPVALLVPRMEILIGISLLAGLFTPLGSLAALGMSVGFAVFVTGALSRGLDIECGCFTGAAKVGGIHLILDLTMIVFSIMVLYLHPDRWRLDVLSSRKLKVVPAAIVVLVLALSASPALHPASGPPPLVFEPALLDLGEVPKGESVERTVTYRNLGAKPLQIVWVQSSCRCTTPQPDKKHLAPGEAGTLKITYKSEPGGTTQPQQIKIFERGNREPAVLRISTTQNP